MQDVVCAIGVLTGVLMIAFTSEPIRGKFEDVPVENNILEASALDETAD